METLESIRLSFSLLSVQLFHTWWNLTPRFLRVISPCTNVTSEIQHLNFGNNLCLGYWILFSFIGLFPSGVYCHLSWQNIHCFVFNFRCKWMFEFCFKTGCWISRSSCKSVKYFLFTFIWLSSQELTCEQIKYFGSLLLGEQILLELFISKMWIKLNIFLGSTVYLV